MPVESGRTDHSQVHVPDQGCTAAPSGDVDLATRDRFERMLSTLCANARGDVHLDLAELNFVDVAGVRALMQAAEELTPPARLVLQNPPTALVRTLELAWPDYPKHGIVLT